MVTMYGHHGDARHTYSMASQHTPALKEAVMLCCFGLPTLAGLTLVHPCSTRARPNTGGSPTRTRTAFSSRFLLECDLVPK